MEAVKQVKESKFHYDLVRDSEKKIVTKLDIGLPYYSFKYTGKIKGEEIIYDTRSGLLTSAGLVLSKQKGGDGIFFKVRKISNLPEELRKPSSKLALSECLPNAVPSDYSLQVASAINDAFSNIFTIDLAEVVRQTIPKIKITVKARVYEIAGGTGFRGKVLFEKAIFKDMITKKRVVKKGVTFQLPMENKLDIADSEIILAGIERNCKGLIPYRESRFEIAQRLLYYANRGPQVKEMKNKREN